MLYACAVLTQKSASVCNRLCASVAAGLYFLMLRIPGELVVISVPVSATLRLVYITDLSVTCDIFCVCEPVVWSPLSVK